MKRVRRNVLFSYALFFLGLLVAFCSQADRTGRADPPFIKACRCGDVAVVRSWLAQTDFDPSQQFYSDYNRAKVSGLAVAAISGHVDVAELLVDAGADIHKSQYNGETPLQTASRNGHLHVVTFLVNSQADVNQGWNKTVGSPLFLACLYGHLDVAVFLVNAGADVNQTWGEGTPLYAASENGYLDIVQYLMSVGADFEKPRGTSTPLFQAAQEGHLEVVRTLLQAGADPMKEWVHHFIFTKNALDAAQDQRYRAKGEAYDRYDSIVKLLQPVVQSRKEIQSYLMQTVDEGSSYFGPFTSSAAITHSTLLPHSSSTGKRQ